MKISSIREVLICRSEISTAQCGWDETVRTEWVFKTAVQSVKEMPLSSR